VPVPALSRQLVQVLRLAQERVLQREQVRARVLQREQARGLVQAPRPVPVHA